MSNLVCPVCGSSNIQTERCPNGFHHCMFCRYSWAIGGLQQKPTIFDRITASPEVLAEKLVYRYDGNGTWRSFLLYGYEFLTKSEAIAATLEKLKEVCDGN